MTQLKEEDPKEWEEVYAGFFIIGSILNILSNYLEEKKKLGSISDIKSFFNNNFSSS